MARGRKNDEEESTREGVEGMLSMLGNARVYSHLVRDRVMAAQMADEVDLLDVALEDLSRLDGLIIQVQVKIKAQGGCRAPVKV